MHDDKPSFLIDLVAEARDRDGVWVKCDDSDLRWCGLEFRIKPLTTQLADRLKRRVKGRTDDLVAVARKTVTELVTDIRPMPVVRTADGNDREAELTEALDYFADIPHFIGWASEQANRLATASRAEVEADLGN